MRILTLLAVAATLSAEPRVAVVVSAQPHPLEAFAASELCRYVETLFGRKVQPSRSQGAARVVFHIGGPASGLTEHAFAFEPSSHGGIRTLTIRGGSPRATLWGVYELVERWGVRYLLHGDVLPANASLILPKQREVREPVFPVRQWRVVNEHAVSQVSWGLADYRPLVDQLAKLKYNRLFLYIWQTQPFLSYTVRGIRPRSGTLFFGFRYPLTDDMIGRNLFPAAAGEFWNPDLPVPGGDPEELYRAAQRHLGRLMEYAESRGLDCLMPATITEFPPEFAPLLKNPKYYKNHRTQVVAPGAGTSVDDAVLTELASTVLKATLDTYPSLKQVVLDVPEFREWKDQYQTAWRQLDAKYAIEKVLPLDTLIASARARPNYPGGSERAVDEVKGDIVGLRFYDRLLAERGLLRDYPKVKLSIGTIAEELFPVLSRLIPPGSETLNFIDYTPQRILKRSEALSRVRSQENPAVLIYTLHDDNVGLLPQLATTSLHRLTVELRRLGWAGFSTRLWLLSDHDLSAAYLARAAWDSGTTPESVYRDHLRAICGEACVPEMLHAFRELEEVTANLEWHGLGLTFFEPRMMMKHWTPKPMSAELRADREGYAKALSAVARARSQSHGAGDTWLSYWADRFRFGVLYLDTVDAVRQAAIAKADDDAASTRRHLGDALAKAREAIEAAASAARDQSDRATVAVLNEYVYRALRSKLAEESR